MNASCRLPIGVFDSGVGGLTVLRAIAHVLPAENLLYLGDTARLPYGTKSRNTVAQYALQAASKLVQRGIKMLVVACNTATAAALPALREAFAPLPVIGVIEAGAAAAVRGTHNGHIAVIATESTIHGNAYQDAITALRPDAVITGRACTLFVPLAEEGWLDGPLVEGIAARYLNPIFTECSVAARPDTLLLGCTHFPPLRAVLATVVGQGVQLVDSAATTALAVVEALQKHNILDTVAEGHCHFMTTDDAERFARVGSLFLGRNIQKNEVECVDL